MNIKSILVAFVATISLVSMSNISADAVSPEAGSANSLPIIALVDPYTCGGNITGNATGSGPFNFTITISNTLGVVVETYNFSGIASGVDYTIPTPHTSSNIPDGTYTIQSVATDVNGITETFTSDPTRIASPEECAATTSEDTNGAQQTVVRTGGFSLLTISAVILGLILAPLSTVFAFSK